MFTAVRISTLAFDVAWEAVGLGATPPALKMESPGATWTERNALAQPAWDELHRVRWAHQGRLVPDAVDALRLLSRSARELYGWIDLPHGPTQSVHVATQGEDAVLAHLAGGHVDLRPVRATAVAESLADVLPVQARGRGTSVTAPVRDLSRPGGHDSQTPAGTLDRIRKLLALPRVGGSQVFAAGRDRLGARRRNPAKVTVLDTTEGRYLVQERGTGDDRWVVLAPADRDTLTRAFAELLSGA